MPQGFVDIVEPMDTLLITAEKIFEMMKSRSCKMKLQPRKKLRSLKITTRNEDPPTDLEIGLDETMIMRLRCQPLHLSLEEVSGQTIRILSTSDKIDLSSEETKRTTTIIGTMSTQLDHSTSQIRTNLEIGEVTMTIHDRLQHRDKNRPSRISAINPDQIRLTLQCLTGFEIETRATIFPTIRNSQLLTMTTGQTWFDSPQWTMELMNYRDYAL